MRRALVPAVLAALLLAPVAGAWTWPAGGVVLQPFLFDPAHPYAAGQHRGIDVGGDPGSPVVAPASGTVTFAGSVPSSGKSVTIETPDGYSVTLTHLGTIAVVRNAAVSEGATVGTIGPSGDPEVAQPYVHLGVRLTADAQGYLDPQSLLPARVAAPPALVPVPDPPPAPAPVAVDAAPAPDPAPDPAPAPAPDPAPAAEPATAPDPGATVVPDPVADPAPQPEPAPVTPSAAEAPTVAVAPPPVTVAPAAQPTTEAPPAPATAPVAADPAVARPQAAVPQPEPGGVLLRVGAIMHQSAPAPQGRRRAPTPRVRIFDPSPRAADMHRPAATAHRPHRTPSPQRTAPHRVRPRTAMAAPLPQRRSAPLAGHALDLLGALPLALAAAAFAAARRKGTPIIDLDALLRDDTHLLRERQAAHRACVHDDRRRHPRAASPPARRRDLLPHRRRRARDERLAGG